MYEEKLEALKKNLQERGSIVVAFSGGVDSTFLLKVAVEALGDQVMAVTARSCTYPERELAEAIAFARKHRIRHKIIVSEEMDIDGFADNPVNRCYLCKKELFTKINQVAQEEGLRFVAEGSNADDTQDFRPGMQAVKELGVVSPLKEVGLTKEEIRHLSKQAGLATWNKQSFACLSSRFPYGEKITREKLSAVEKAEQQLLDFGFRQVRVRHHGTIARIEVGESEFERFFDVALREKIFSFIKELGFAYVTLDLKGYRTGSMNEVLDETTKSSVQ